MIMRYSTMNKSFSIAILVLVITCCSCGLAKSDIYELSEQDKKEIEALKRNIPMVLANEGWEAYEKLFSKNYQNWSMIGDELRQRDEFLLLVKDWYEAGNKAIGSEVESIGFIPLAENKVLYLSKQTESFSVQNSGESTLRDIRFVSVFVKEEGMWKVDFSAFMDTPNK
jgi:hypothetical protein